MGRGDEQGEDEDDERSFVDCFVLTSRILFELGSWTDLFGETGETHETLNRFPRYYSVIGTNETSEGTCGCVIIWLNRKKKPTRSRGFIAV